MDFNLICSGQMVAFLALIRGQCEGHNANQPRLPPHRHTCVRRKNGEEKGNFRRNSLPRPCSVVAQAFHRREGALRKSFMVLLCLLLVNAMLGCGCEPKCA